MSRRIIISLALLGCAFAASDPFSKKLSHDLQIEVPRLAQLLGEFAVALAAFWQDLGERVDDVAVVTMSEFGRTAKENGSRGTDHGHANVMFAFGGGIPGGRVHGDWPGLAAEKLYEGRDLAVTTDFRTVLS